MLAEARGVALNAVSLVTVVLAYLPVLRRLASTLLAHPQYTLMRTQRLASVDERAQVEVCQGRRAGEK